MKTFMEKLFNKLAAGGLVSLVFLFILFSLILALFHSVMIISSSETNYNSESLVANILISVIESGFITFIIGLMFSKLRAQYNKLEEYSDKTKNLTEDVLKALPVGVWIADKDGQIIFANKTAENVWQGKKYVKPDEYSEYKGWWYDSKEPIKPEEWGMYRALNNGEECLDEVIEIEAFDGTKKVILHTAIPVRDADGNITGGVVTNYDVTKAKTAEEEIKSQWKQFISILDNFPEVLYITDPDTYEILFVNSNFQKALGKEVKGGICYKEFQGFDKPCEFCTNNKLKEPGSIYTWEYHNPLLNKDYLITDQLIKWADGRNVRFEVAVDITHNKAVENKLKQALTELERSNRELEQFAYVASHDLQEPLRMVSSYVQLLEQKYRNKLDGDALDYMNFAVDGAIRMRNIINDLLQFSRVGTRAKPFKEVDMNKILSEVRTMLSVLIEDSGTNISSESLPVLNGDETQLMQLLQNLISNAIKFSGENNPEINISCSDVGDFYQFTVSDNGMGIEENYFERIFLIFQRLNNKSKYGGTGIGLAICKKIIERHKGKIWVTSETGVGSDFHFTIPKGGENV